jgi:hypothetical protein
VDGLRAIGCSVCSLARVGDGCPDIWWGWRGVDGVMEIKTPGERLNPRQKRFHSEWQGAPIPVVYSFQDALLIVQHRTRQG